LVEDAAALRRADEDVVVHVPSAVADFDGAHAVLDEAAGEKTALPEGIVAVALADELVLLPEVEGLEILALHDADGVVVHLGVGADLLHVVALVELGVELAREGEALVEGLLLQVAE